MKINDNPFSNSGINLGTRILGQRVRMEIESVLDKNELVVFDFEGVDFISHGFADECFGKLLLSIKLEDFKSQTTFKNANPLIKEAIAFTLKESLRQLESI